MTSESKGEVSSMALIPATQNNDAYERHLDRVCSDEDAAQGTDMLLPCGIGSDLPWSTSAQRSSCGSL